MGSALGFTAVGGIGLSIYDQSEPDITIVRQLNRSKIYVRRTMVWKEAIAEFVNHQHAEFFAAALQLDTI